MEAIASGLEAIASRLEVTAIRLEKKLKHNMQDSLAALALQDVHLTVVERESSHGGVDCNLAASKTSGTCVFKSQRFCGATLNFECFRFGEKPSGFMVLISKRLSGRSGAPYTTLQI